MLSIIGSKTVRKIPSGFKITCNLKPAFIGCGEGDDFCSILIHYRSGHIRDKLLDGFLAHSEVVRQLGRGGPSGEMAQEDGQLETRGNGLPEVGVLLLQVGCKPDQQVIKHLWGHPGVVLELPPVILPQLFHQSVVLSTFGPQLYVEHGSKPSVVLPFLLRRLFFFRIGQHKLIGSGHLSISHHLLMEQHHHSNIIKSLRHIKIVNI